MYTYISIQGSIVTYEIQTFLTKLMQILRYDTETGILGGNAVQNNEEKWWWLQQQNKLRKL